MQATETKYYTTTFLGIRWSASSAFTIMINTTKADGFALMINPKRLYFKLKVGHWIGINCNTLDVGVFPPQLSFRRRVN